MTIAPSFFPSLFFSSSKFNCFAEVTEGAKYSAVLVTAIFTESHLLVPLQTLSFSVNALFCGRTLTDVDSLRLAAVSSADGLSFVGVV
jgi:hypothetical protein